MQTLIRFIAEYPNCLFSIDSFGFTAFQYAQKNKNKRLFSFLLDQKHKERVRRHNENWDRVDDVQDNGYQ